MIDREHEVLMHEVLDGQASAADAARLDAWLATSAEGRQRRQELEALFAALAAVPRAPAPAGLRDDVLAAIRAGSVAAPAKRGWMRVWWLVPAAAAAVALVIASPWGRLGLRQESLPDVSGSLAARPHPPGTVLSVAGARVAISSVSSLGGTSVLFRAETNAPLAIELDAAAATLARARVEGLAPEAVRPDAARGRLTLALAGPARFTLNFLPGLRRDEAVRVVIRAGGLHAEGALPQAQEEP